MSYHNTVLAQLLKFVPRHEFDGLAKAHHVGQRLRKTSRWDQFVSLLMAQLSGRQGLRDIEANLNAQFRSHYHLGCRRVSTSTLARVNEQQPYTLYEALFTKLVERCQSYSPMHKFRFRNPLISLEFYNARRPHSRHDRRTPDSVCFKKPPLLLAA
jgi:putative transposase